MLDANEVVALLHTTAATRPALRSRLERAALIALFREVNQIEPERWRVEASRPVWVAEKSFYDVHLADGAGETWCTCPDWKKAPDQLCKHLLAVGFVLACRRPVAQAAD